MFPIRDHNPSGKTAWVTWALIAVNVAVHLWVMAALQTDRQLHAFYLDYAVIPAKLSNGEGYLGLVTSVFLHGGLLHLAGNMLFLWIFGDNLEEAMGHVGFLLFYLVCGAGAAVAQWASAPWSPVPTIGASGAIAGVMGGYLLMFPRARVDVLIFLVVFVRIIPLPAWLMLGLWFLLQLANGVGADPLTGGVAYWAHAGGFVLGLVLALPAWLRRGGRAHWQATAGQPPHPEARYGTLSPTRVPSVRRRGGGIGRGGGRNPWGG
jgi:membrane associated rhomboid family serine protease